MVSQPALKFPQPRYINKFAEERKSTQDQLLTEDTIVDITRYSHELLCSMHGACSPVQNGYLGADE